MTAYALMFALAFVSSIVFFLPVEVVILALANIDKAPPVVLFGTQIHLAQYSADFPWLLPLAAAFGSNFGSGLFYLMGKGSLKIGGRLKKKLDDFDFERFGKGRDALVFFSALTRIPPVFVVAVAAGMIQYSFPRYYVASFIGKAARLYIVLLIAYFAIQTAEKLF